METFEALGNKIEFLDGGGCRVTMPNGKVVTLDKDGHVQIDLETISRVGIENIIHLKSHVIMRESDLTVHNLEFDDGGKVKFAFTKQGKLVEFSGHRIGQTLTSDNAIVIRSFTAAENEKKA